MKVVKATSMGKKEMYTKASNDVVMVDDEKEERQQKASNDVEEQQFDPSAASISGQGPDVVMSSPDHEEDIDDSQVFPDVTNTEMFPKRKRIRGKTASEAE